MRSDTQLIEHIFELIDNKTTDLGDEDWLEPVEHYSSQERFNAELRLMRHLPIAFCPVAALPDPGSYVARASAGVPIVVVRGMDGEIRAFRNACRHRGMQLAEGTGCTKIFRCTYHGWAYRLDGRLEYIPDDYGFPDLDKMCIRDSFCIPQMIYYLYGMKHVRCATEILAQLSDDGYEFHPSDLDTGFFDERFEREKMQHRDAMIENSEVPLFTGYHTYDPHKKSWSRDPSDYLASGAHTKS